MQVTIPMLVYGLMYTVALTVDALVVVDAPESSLISQSVSQVIRSKSLQLRLGNPKAAAHVAVRPSVLVTVKY